MIPAFIASTFPASVGSRGEGYFTSRRVHLAGSTSRPVLTAIVMGSARYSVELAATPRRMTAACSCPYAGDNGVCKHIWATLRQAEDNGSLAGLLGITGMRASFHALADEDFISTDDGFDDADDFDHIPEGESDVFDKAPYDDDGDQDIGTRGIHPADGRRAVSLPGSVASLPGSDRSPDRADASWCLAIGLVPGGAARDPLLTQRRSNRDHVAAHLRNGALPGAYG